MHDASRPSATHSSHDADDDVPHFDAEHRGCGDGLAAELRRRIEDVEVGQQLRVTVRDASAKVDIPSVARLLGHRVVSEESFTDGRLVMLLERGK